MFNKNYEDLKKNNKTSKYLSKYEITKILSKRCEQLESGCLPLIDNYEIYNNVYDIALKELKDVLDNKDAKAEDIKAKVEALNAVAMKLGEIMYKESQQKNENKDPTGKSNGKEKKEEDVVDADFEEVKPKPEEDKKSAKK